MLRIGNTHSPASTWDVEIVHCDLDRLPSLADRPMIVDVGLPSAMGGVAPMYREAGWVPGQKHSIVLLGFKDPSTVHVFDPAPNIGREQWNTLVLRTLWQGRAIRLVERYPQPTRPLLAVR